MKSRIFDAIAMFEKGYNCSQSVFVTYADIYGIDREMALNLSSPLGAGVGRMREICGAVSAMALLSGLQEGNVNPQDEEAKAALYQNVRSYSDAFQKQMGSIICRDLLELLEREESAVPDKRTEEYYSSRPCSKAVAVAAKIVEDMIIKGEFVDKI